MKYKTILTLLCITITGCGPPPYHNHQLAELEGAECADLGYVPGSHAFEDCRWKMHRNAINKHRYYYNSDFAAPAFYGKPHHEIPYYPRPYQQPPQNHDPYTNEYGQDCKKTHRGWVMCK